MDDQLRRAQRRAKSGELDDEAALLIEQLRAGKVPLKKLRQRAQKGDQAARRAHRVQYASARTYTEYFTSDRAVEGFFEREPVHGFPNTILPGDRIVPVRVEKRQLFAFGSVILDDLVRTDRIYWQRALMLVEQPLRRRLVPKSVLDGWTFQTPKGEARPIKHVQDGMVLRSAAVQGLYLLSDATARTVVEFLAS